MEIKELLAHSDIRTMKKDLKKLREADALKEREKIKNLKTPEGKRQEAFFRKEELEKEALALKEKVKAVENSLKTVQTKTVVEKSAPVIVVNTEEVQRRKFMEDVEKWAKDSQN